MGILPQLIINSLFAGSVYALGAMSFNLIFSNTKFFNFVHGSYPVISGYAVLFLVSHLGWPWYFAALAGLAASGLTAFILDKVINLPLRKRKSTSTVKLVASLGTYTVIQALVAILFTSQFQSLAGLNFTPKIYQLGSAVFTQTQLAFFICAVVVLIGLMLMLKFTLFGKAVTAIADDEEVAKIVGINTDKIISQVFIIGASIAGLAGIITMYDTGMEPTIGLAFLLKSVIAAVVGSMGSIPGAFIAAFILGFAENFGILRINGEWKDAIAFGLLILFLLFRPQGIMKK